MKKISAFLLVILLVAFASCKKEEYNTYDAPQWQADFGDYSETMTAVVDLPNSIKPYMQTTDEMAVFIGDQCRGTAELVEGKFFINIKGAPDEVSPITFYYYSAGNKYKYKYESDITFQPNRVIGTYDDPFVPVFTNI